MPPSPNGVATTFEIKFLAQREVVFELNRASFSVPNVELIIVQTSLRLDIRPKVI